MSSGVVVPWLEVVGRESNEAKIAGERGIGGGQKSESGQREGSGVRQASIPPEATEGWLFGSGFSCLFRLPASGGLGGSAAIFAGPDTTVPSPITTLFPLDPPLVHSFFLSFPQGSDPPLPTLQQSPKRAHHTTYGVLCVRVSLPVDKSRRFPFHAVFPGKRKKVEGQHSKKRNPQRPRGLNHWGWAAKMKMKMKTKIKIKYKKGKNAKCHEANQAQEVR